MSAAHVLVLEAVPGPLTEAAAADRGIACTSDIDACLAGLRSDPPPQLVAVGTWPQPLSAARQIRRASPQTGVALCVRADQVETTRTKLLLAPELSNTVVLALDDDRDRLLAGIHETATSAERQRSLRQALDAMNRSMTAAPRQASRPGAVPPAAYLAAVIDHAPDAIIAIDADEAVVTLNDAASQLFGRPLEEAEGRPVHELFGTQPADALDGLLGGVASGQGRHALLELEHDGERRTLSVTAAPLRDERGQAAGQVVIARDVTRERRADERLRNLQQAESLATLAGGVAHDFNNLLVAIQGWATIARDAGSDGDLLTQALDGILEASSRAADLARAMLAYSGRGSTEVTRLDLRSLAGDLLRLLRTSVPPKVTLELPDGPPVSVDADPSQLRQVIMNLVVNAGEAIGSAQGRITLTVGVDHLDAEVAGPDGSVLPPGEYARLTVEDDGPGIDPETATRIFEPFFSTKFAGRGLGLAASAGIAAAHGGLLDVDGRPGHGARFRLLLPTPKAT